MLSGSFLCPNVPQVSHCHSLVQVSLLTKVFVIDLRVSATAGPPVNECPLWGDCPPVGGSHIECPGWCLLILSTVTYRLCWHSRGTQHHPILGNISAFHFDPSTVASSVHWCPPVGHRECPLWARSPIGVPSASAVARHCAVVTSIRRNIHIFGVHLCNIALHCFTILHICIYGVHQRYITLHCSVINRTVGSNWFTMVRTLGFI